MTWASRLRKSLKNFRPFPHWEPFPIKPPLRVEVTAADEDVRFWSDIRYFQDLSDTIYDDCRLTAAEVGREVFAGFVAHPLLQMLAVPVESPAFAAQWSWPDHAAALIEQWRIDIEVRGMLETIETDAA